MIYSVSIKQSAAKALTKITRDASNRCGSDPTTDYSSTCVPSSTTRLVGILK